MLPNKKITKAVITVAGFGTRFLPQTKAFAKEMLPIVDKPIIQIIVEELVEAGITDVIIVTSYHKRVVEDHFDLPHQDLVKNILRGGNKKRPLLKELEKISNIANFYFVRQKGPYGNGTPLVNVKPLIGNEPFLYFWGDDFVVGKPKSRARQLIDTYQKYNSSVLTSLKAKNDTDYDKYGVVSGDYVESDLMEVKKIVEKPGKKKAPSNLVTVSGFLFTPDIFNYLGKAVRKLPKGNELYWVDIVKLMITDGKKVLAKEITGGKYYDTGSKLGYLEAD